MSIYVNKIIDYLNLINDNKPFFTGVPDSKLKPLCNYLYSQYGVNTDQHIIAANEGNAIAIAAGYYMATGNIPVVYMQNSGLGNIINPYESLMRIYKIPCILIVGWRGEPGIHDEPQHLYQGADTLKQLEILDIDYAIFEEKTDISDLDILQDKISSVLSSGKGFAFVIKKAGLVSDIKTTYSNTFTMSREEIISHIVKFAKANPIISTTGKTSRELFEIREKLKQGHEKDFLTVGSMGHSSSIALGIAKACSDKRIWCIDGDGAAIMHLGSMAVIGSNNPQNLIHIVINNEAHESVGGLPTASKSVEFATVAKACGYKKIYHVINYQELDEVLDAAVSDRVLTFIVADAAIGSRPDLGRPTTSPQENIDTFREFLSQKGYV